MNSYDITKRSYTKRQKGSYVTLKIALFELKEMGRPYVSVVAFVLLALCVSVKNVNWKRCEY